MESRENTKVDKPWGSYSVLEEAKDYWIKKLYIKQGERLSLQSHKKRKEVWVVVSGTIKATKGEAEMELKTGGSLVIDRGEKHRIEGVEDALVVEVAYGSADEEDITRYEDDYGREK